MGCHTSSLTIKLLGKPVVAWSKMNLKNSAMSLAFAAVNRCQVVAKPMQDTAKTKNLNVKLPSFKTQLLAEVISVETMEDCLRNVGSDMGLYISHTTNLSRKRYPGNRHWHLKQDHKERGCLDVTYWPDGSLLWISVRLSEPEWVHFSGPDLKDRLEVKLISSATADK